LEQLSDKLKKGGLPLGEVIKIDLTAGAKKQIKNQKAEFERIEKTSIIWDERFKVGSINRGLDAEFITSLYLRKPDLELRNLIVELIKKVHPRYRFHLLTLGEAFNELLEAKKDEENFVVVVLLDKEKDLLLQQNGIEKQNKDT